MNLIDVTKTYGTKEACLEKLERMRWPNGVCCIKCGVVSDENGKPLVMKFVTAETQRTRRNKSGVEKTVTIPPRRLYECKECGYQFSVTTDTVFHKSHISLEKWFIAVSLILQAKKGISSLQVGRHLGVTEKNTKSTWYLCHRIREAAIEAGFLSGLVEADHTYLTPKKPRKGKPYVKKENRDVVMGMIERGGKLRLVPVKDAKIEITEAMLDKTGGKAGEQFESSFPSVAEAIATPLPPRCTFAVIRVERGRHVYTKRSGWEFHRDCARYPNSSHPARFLR